MHFWQAAPRYRCFTAQRVHGSSILYRVMHAAALLISLDCPYVMGDFALKHESWDARRLARIARDPAQHFDFGVSLGDCRSLLLGVIDL